MFGGPDRDRMYQLAFIRALEQRQLERASRRYQDLVARVWSETLTPQDREFLRQFHISAD